MHYTIPNTKVEVHEVLPGTHVSPETAYLIDDYPYGFRLRCKIRYWLDCNPKHGVRLVSQTTNPKRGDVWNKPKASTYSLFAGAMFLDQDGHVQWTGIGAYRDTAGCIEWRDVFGQGVPECCRKILNAFINARISNDENRAKAEVTRVTTGAVTEDRLFICGMPTGVSYTDRRIVIAGDYKRLAHLFYDTLELRIVPDCPDDLLHQIEAHAARIQARRGEQYQVSTSGQTVLLGSALEAGDRVQVNILAISQASGG